MRNSLNTSVSFNVLLALHSTFHMNKPTHTFKHESHTTIKNGYKPVRATKQKSAPSESQLGLCVWSGACACAPRRRRQTQPARAQSERDRDSDTFVVRYATLSPDPAPLSPHAQTHKQKDGSAQQTQTVHRTPRTASQAGRSLIHRPFPDPHCVCVCVCVVLMVCRLDWSQWRRL